MDHAHKEPIRFEEKVRPALWIWLVAAGFSASWILVFAPIDMTIGILISLGVFVLLALGLNTITPRLEVTAQRVRAGRASIEPRFLANAEALREDAARAARGTEFNARSYQVIRGWVPSLVRVDVVDPEDATPYWLISTRRPEALAAAINHAAEADRAQASPSKETSGL